MKIILFVLSTCVLLILGVNYLDNPVLTAIDFKKMQYIYFQDTHKMLHSESDLSFYKRFENKQDFRDFKKYQGNFKVSDIKVKEISNSEKVVSFTLKKPDIAKIIPVFGERPEMKVLLDKENLPLVELPVSVHLKREKFFWKVLVKEKLRPLSSDNK